MTRANDEPDFLVGTQLEVDPSSFQQVVREAFLLEHDCLRDQEIATVLGVDNSRVSQILKNPKKLKAESIQNILDVLGRSAHRGRIVRAWAKECFGEDIDRPLARPLTGKRITEKTLQRVDRQIRQSRLATAVRTAQEAAAKTDDLLLREQFLDRAYYARQRLDEPGEAMRVARIIADHAKARGDNRRLGAAQMFRVRLLVSLPNTSPEVIDPIFRTVSDLIRAAGPEPVPAPPYVIARDHALATLRLSSTILFVERGQIKADEVFLRTELQNAIQEATKSRTYQTKFRAHLVAARIHLVLGETFQAQEQVDKAFKSGDVKNLNAFEICGLIQSRILQQTDSPRAAARYLRGVVQNCNRTLDYYHKRLAEHDLTLLESGMFPPS